MDNSAEQSKADEKQEIPRVTVTITEDSFTAPDTIAAGYVNIQLVNEAADMHSAHLIKLDEGYSSRQLIEAYADSMLSGGARPEWMTHRGGVISETGTSDITIFLDAGNYTWVCVMGTDSVPHFKGHESSAVIVVGEVDSAIKMPDPDVVINMTDKNHEIDSKVEPGMQSVQVVNSGTKYHLVAISKLDQDATADDVVSWFTSYNGPPPATGIVATSAIGPGLTAHLNIDFEPGTYVAYCMANAEGNFHLMDGAITTFTVE